MKGSGDLINSFLMILVILILVTVIMYIVLFGSTKDEKITLKEMSVVKVRNTFNLVNKSLGTTWRIGGVQSIFNTADESIGCGFENTDLDKFYWFQTNPKAEKTNTKGAEIFPEEKYNKNMNPAVCTPKKTDLDKYLNSKMGKYKKIDRRFEINGVNINIDKININLDSSDYGIRNTASQEITASYGKCEDSETCIQSRTMNENNIPTELPLMVKTGNEVVKSLIDLSNSFIEHVVDGDQQITNPEYKHYLRYQDIQALALDPNDPEPFTPTPNYIVYTSNMKDLVRQTLVKNKRFLKNAWFDIYIDDTNSKLIVPESDGIIASGSGVLFHYNAAVVMTETSITPAIDCKPIPDEYRPLIEKYVDNNLPDIVNKFSYNRDDIIALIAAIINTESSWNPDAVREEPQINDASYGLMQILLGTAQGDDACNDQSITGIQLSDPEKNIECGTKYFSTILTKYLNKNAISDDARIMLALAAYNAGPRRITNFIDDGITDWASIAPRLPAITQAYVPKVTGCFNFYGGDTITFDFTGASSQNLYYYNNEQNRFIPRPVRLEMNVEDYFVVIDCAQELYDYRHRTLRSYRFFNWEPFGHNKPDMMCHRTMTEPYKPQLVTCGTIIPGAALMQPGENRRDDILYIKCTDQGFEVKERM